MPLKSSRALHGLLFFLYFLVTSLVSISGGASSLRVTVWDLERTAWITGGTNSQEVSPGQGATTQNLLNSNPDVILLQNVPDWESCVKMAALLQPGNFQVVTCSAFRDKATQILKKEQTAILARQPAVTTGMEQWTSSTGFTFAVFEKSGERVGVYSVQSAANSQVDGLTPLSQQKNLLQSVQALEAGVSNQIKTVIIGGVFSIDDKETKLKSENFVAGLAPSGFENKINWAPESNLAESGKMQFIQTKGISEVANIAFAPNFGSEYKPLTCDLRWSPSTAASLKAPINLAGAPVNTTSATWFGNDTKLIHSLTRTRGLLALILLAVVFFGLITVAVLFGIKRKMQPSQVLVPMVSAPADLQQQVVDEFGLSVTERQGLVAGISSWLKNKFLQRLLSERVQFAESQRQAALAVIRMDERLKEVEKEVRQSKQAYEDRIADLTLQLAASQKENRELIRAKIESLKQQMAKSAPIDLAPGQRN